MKILIPFLNTITMKTFSDFLLTTGISIISFFAPLALMYHTFFFAVMLDMITGMIASKKRGEKIESRKMRKTILKLLVYILVASAFYMFQMAVMPAVPFINLVFGLIIITELKSMTENCDIIFNVKTFGKIYDFVNGLWEKIFNKKEN
jgi:hypothetical protein